MSFDIRFYGRDFTEISKDLSRTKDSEDNIEINVSDDVKLRIFKHFLDSVKDEFTSVVANRRPGTKIRNPKLFIDNSGDYRFDGYVGVVTKTIAMQRSDIIEEVVSEESKEEEIKVTLQIQSRFDCMDEKEFKPYFLVTMLKSVFDIKTMTAIPSNEEDFFYFLLIIMFRNHVLEAYRKGYYKTYHRFEENNDRIRGSIDISRHIKLNMGMKNGKVAYSYREHTTNNYLNHLIIEAFTYLKRRYPNFVNDMIDNNRNFGKIMEQLKYDIGYPKYSPGILISKNSKPLSHPFFTEYEQLRKTSLKVLRDESLSPFGDTAGHQVEGFLFYIPDLWEMFLEKNMKLDHFIINGQTEIKTFDYNDSNDYKQKTFPDYVFYHEDERDKPFMILDAKFKPAWGERIGTRSTLGDRLLDDYRRCIQYMNSINGHATGTIFPTSDDSICIEESKWKDQLTEFCVHKISEYNTIDRFYTIPVYVLPTNALKYEEWIDSFKNTLNITMELLNDCVKKEYDYAKKILSAYSELAVNR